MATIEISMTARITGTPEEAPDLLKSLRAAMISDMPSPVQQIAPATRQEPPREPVMQAIPAEVVQPRKKKPSSSVGTDGVTELVEEVIAAGFLDDARTSADVMNELRRRGHGNITSRRVSGSLHNMFTQKKVYRTPVEGEKKGWLYKKTPFGAPPRIAQETQSETA